MAMAQVKPDTVVKMKTDTGNPLTAADLREVVERLGLDSRRAAELLQAVETVVAGQRQLVEESKHEAIRALSEGFAAKMERLQQQHEAWLINLIDER